MGRTRFGQAAPYCPKCEKYVLKLRDKFGTPCPHCTTPTVHYHDWKMAQLYSAIRTVRLIGGKEDHEH